MGNRKNFVVPGGLTIDSSTLYVDDPNNRVGIGKTDPSYELDVTGVVRASNGVVTLTTSGTPTASLPDGAIAIDTTNAKLFFRSSSTWTEVSGGGGGGGGGSLTVATTAPVSPSEGDLWYESDSGITFVYYDSFWIEIGPSVIDELSSTVTTKGDILVTSSAIELTRLGVGTDNQILVADSSATNGIAWKISPVIDMVEAKGDLLVAAGGDNLGRIAVGSNNSILTADSAQGSGVKWSTQTVGLSLAESILVSAKENISISAVAATGTVNVDCANYSCFYYTSNASANWTFNLRSDSTRTLNSIMSTGESLSVAFLVTQGATAYYASAIQVDGSSITPKWIGGTALAAGNPNSIDSYLFNIIKTADATFTILATMTGFK